MEKKKILIVEDDAVVGENLKDNLEELGYLVVGICITGEEAVQKAKKIRPNLILMDIKLEGEMDGVEASKEIQRELNVPVVYLTAYADEKIFPDLKDTAPYGVLNKPARMENIRSAIEVALYKYEMEMAQKKANEAALKAKTAAEKANQAKSKFLSHTSHEIRGPTNAIKGFTELLLKTRLNAKQEAYVKKIKISADTLLNLINDILDLSKVESGKLPLEKRDSSIKRIIQDVLASQYLRAKEKDIKKDKGKTPFRASKCFIVHGHDEVSKLQLMLYLQNTLKFPEPIILQEKPEGGRTIIEKFEAESKDVDLVFILLTPDDIVLSSEETNDPKRRARQNVIFEMGYFLGKLSRNSRRVILLHKGEIELPSDIAGWAKINISNGIEAAGEKIRKEISDFLPKKR